jgi:DNA-binding NarL/FixJ family response regulator
MVCAPEELPRPRTRVVIADDHVLTRAGLRVVLSDDPDFEVVGEASNGSQALAIIRSLRPDLVLMDLRMSGMDGLEATRLVKEAVPTTTVLILSMVDEAELAVEALKAGAAGYVLKSASETDLRAAMHDVLAGNLLVDRRLVRDVLWRVASAAPAPAPAPPVAHHEVLSSREREVLDLLARGCTNREIAEELVIGSSTVKVHVEHILAKLGVGDRTQAAVRAIQMGYVIHRSSAPLALHPA